MPQRGAHTQTKESLAGLEATVCEADVLEMRRLRWTDPLQEAVEIWDVVEMQWFAIEDWHCFCVYGLGYHQEHADRYTVVVDPVGAPISCRAEFANGAGLFLLEEVHLIDDCAEFREEVLEREDECRFEDGFGDRVSR